MKVEQIYTGCLAHGAYYIESNGEAAIVDPLREIAPYLERAKSDGASIRYVLETHFHADFVSGHLDLARASGAQIVFGPTAQPAFEAHVATDGELLPLGKVFIKVLHTPGHTMESATYLLIDEAGKEHAIFSGDTLFINDVGRPDLAQKAGVLTLEDLASHLYTSLRTKIMTLPDEVIVYPGHGAGSACGKNMSKETTDTLGHQKQFNYALRADMTREAFIREVTEGLVAPPGYFPLNARMNREGYDSIDDVLARGIRPLSPEAFEAAANETGALLLDTRSPEVFGQGFIPNSINIGIDGTFAPWVGALIPDIRQEMLIIADADQVQEVVTRLARVGYDFAIGYLEGGFEAWKAAGKEIDRIESVSAGELARRRAEDPALRILDVRKASEYQSEHLVGVDNVPLDFINQQMARVPADTPCYIHCAGGYRSMIFVSILRARGYENLINVEGGFGAIKKTGQFEVTEYVAPTTML
ncbi:MAG: rhodanese-like domain-containing protein [Bacteroidia bacterium]|nr:rhodanese-like domain-containing protein [Bacteroidia bacterium]